MKFASSDAKNSAALATSHPVPIFLRSGTLLSRSASTSARVLCHSRARVSTAIGVFIIDRNFSKAAAFAGAGALLTFFGFMHGERIGFAQGPMVAAAYLAVGAVCLVCSKLVFAPAKSPAPKTETLAEPVAPAGAVLAE